MNPGAPIFGLYDRYNQCPHDFLACPTFNTDNGQFFTKQLNGSAGPRLVDWVAEIAAGNTPDSQVCTSVATCPPSP